MRTLKKVTILLASGVKYIIIKQFFEIVVKPHVTLGKGEYRKPAMQANCDTSEKPVREGIACCCVLCPVVGSFESPLSLYISRWHAVVCSRGLKKLQANPL